jgi:hypothetical protein
LQRTTSGKNNVNFQPVAHLIRDEDKGNVGRLAQKSPQYAVPLRLQRSRSREKAHVGGGGVSGAGFQALRFGS